MSVDSALNMTVQQDSQDGNQDKFLSFRLGKEEYGVEILRVREIIGVLDITPLPQTPDYVRGVINLRGKIIPVIELRTKFGMPPKPFTEETCIIVVEVTDPQTDEKFQMGVLVDTVSEVQDIARSMIEPAPKFGGGLNTAYILGMGKVKHGETETVLILLDIDKVMSQEEMGAISQARQDTPTPESVDPDALAA
ncbi:MAG: chemotaxis protein CheW [Phycisphaerales bacterium]